ncbi:MAG: polysaccharide deacetylase family protein [Gemmatimonadetes bacterium]|nr:polysaccharide deacetylase family protein [Gemmatimonadota bacterium]
MIGARALRRWSGAARAFVRRRSRRGLVLLYHRVAGPRFDPMLLDVAPARFVEHLDVLRATAAVLPLGEFESLRRAGRLPPRAVAVTFDDGYADNLLAAAPRLQAAGVPATVFVTAGMVGGAGEFWWDDVERIAFAPRPLGGDAPALAQPWSAEASASEVDARWNVFAAPHTARQRLFLTLCGALGGLPSPERDRHVATLREWAGVSATARDSHRTLSRAELAMLAAVPGIAVGAHTMTHPRLSAQEPAVQRRELQESRETLEGWLGRPVPHVAYPFGTDADVSAATVRAARAAGFAAAFVNMPAPAWRWDDALRVPRLLVRDWDAATFESRLHAWWAA